MENFLLIREYNLHLLLSNDVVKDYFTNRSGIFKKLGEFVLFLNKKGDQYPDNYYQYKDSFIGATGTFTYKGLSFTESIKAILIDECEKKLNTDNLFGHYYLFIWSGNELKIFNDGTEILKAYCDTDYTCLCSSFIIITKILNYKFTLNRPAVIENLVTGGIIGKETLLNEIEVFGPGTASKFAPLKFITPEIRQNETTPGNKKQALFRQMEILDNYFLMFKNLADEFGVDTGLTGGYDSRLVLSFIIKHYRSFQVHCHFRNRPDIETDISRLIAHESNIEFVSPEVRQSGSLSDEEINGILSGAFNFYDAQIRLHCYWLEEYNTPEYRMKVLGNKKLGFHGIGGEQYRNADRFFFKTKSFHNWAKYKYVRKAGGDTFVNKHSENLTVERIKHKIKMQLGFNEKMGKITLSEFKRIHNEILIPAYRGARTCAENRLSFFLSPFADFKVAVPAYQVVPFLDVTNNFEIELIKKSSPELARYPSTYGFSFDKKEPFLKYLGPVLFENLLPGKLSCKIREIYKQRKSKKSSKRIFETSEFLKEYIQNVKDLKLPLSVEKLLDRPDCASLAISMGFFLKEYDSYLKKDGDIY